MRVGHADEAATVQRRLMALLITEREVAADGREPDVKLVAVTEQIYVGEPDHVAALDAQLEDQPVRQVDEILVEHGQAAQDRRLAVVTAVRIGAGIVHTVSVFPLRRAAHAQVAVARRGQRLTKALGLGIKAVICEQETVHGTSVEGCTQSAPPAPPREGNGFDGARARASQLLPLVPVTRSPAWPV